MFPIREASSHPPPYHSPPPSHPQNKRIHQASKPIFQRVKETLSRIWSATVFTFKVAGEKISFVFFRVLWYIHPSLGPKIEVLFLRITNVFRSIKDRWRQDAIRKEMNSLRIQNQELKIQVQQLEPIALDRDRLQQENTLLLQTNQTLTQQNTALEERAHFFHNNHNSIQNTEKAIALQRDTLATQNDHFRAEQEKLSSRNAEIEQILSQLRTTNEQLTQQLALREGEVTDLRAQAQFEQKTAQCLQQIAKACNQVRQTGQKTELDNHLESLLPLLLEQIQEAYNKLFAVKAQVAIAKQQLPAYDPAEVPFQSLERILSALTVLLNRIPPMFKLHAHWASLNPLNLAQEV